MPPESDKPSGFAEYMAALNMGLFKQAFTPILDFQRNNLMALAKELTDAHWRQAAAELRAKNATKPIVPQQQPASAVQASLEEQHPAMAEKNASRRKPGPKPRLIPQSTKMSEKAVAEIEQLFIEGKTDPREIAAELGFDVRWVVDPNQKVLKVIRRVCEDYAERSGDPPGNPPN